MSLLIPVIGSRFLIRGQDYKIDAILAYDIHFEQAGFTALLRG